MATVLLRRRLGPSPLMPRPARCLQGLQRREERRGADEAAAEKYAEAQIKTKTGKHGYHAPGEAGESTGKSKAKGKRKAKEVDEDGPDTRKAEPPVGCR